MDKKIRCSRCGGEHLQFVNVPYSVKGKCDILRYFRVGSWFSAILFLLFSIAQIYNCNYSTQKNSNIVLLIIFSTLCAISFLNAMTFSFISYFIPYKNENIIEYVCERCGNVGDLKNIALKDIECVPSKEESTGS